MGSFLSLFFIIIASLQEAESARWSIRGGFGYADANDLGEILSLQPSPHPAGTSAGGIDMGRILSRETWGLPLDFYVKGGFNVFFENGHQKDFPEVTLYLKAYWNFRPYDNTVRVGFGEGVSYAFGIPTVERIEAEAEGDNNSRLLNYLDISLDFDVGGLIRYNPLKETYFGYALKHRSGIYGLVNEVHRGGSNYNLFYVEHNF